MIQWSLCLFIDSLDSTYCMLFKYTFAFLAVIIDLSEDHNSTDHAKLKFIISDPPRLLNNVFKFCLNCEEGQFPLEPSWVVNIAPSGRNPSAQGL